MTEPTTDNLTCHECRGALREGLETLDRTFAGVTFTAAVPSLVCQACGASSVRGQDWERFDNAITRELVKRGLRSPEVVKWLRKGLGLRAADLAELLHVTAETVSRWERGAVDIDHATFAVLGALVVERLEGRTDMQDRLRAINAPLRSSRVALFERIAT